MAAMAAAGLQPRLAGRQVELVIDRHEIGRLQLVETHGFTDRLTRQVHEGLRLDQQHPLAG
ncbi:hypothetical protein D3C87_2209640 [compost metagenome]